MSAKRKYRCDNPVCPNCRPEVPWKRDVIVIAFLTTMLLCVIYAILFLCGWE